MTDDDNNIILYNVKATFMFQSDCKPKDMTCKEFIEMILDHELAADEIKVELEEWQPPPTQE